MGYEIPEWAMEIAERLGVEPHELMQVLTGPGRRWPRPVRGTGDLPALMVIGRTGTGTPLAVVMRPLSQWDQQVIGVLAVTGDLLAEFERWEKGNE
ncbi:hypothetical protein H0264_32675 [Nocardia huaxiensis]|uniref:Uncharacterized protein n=1 Tax=Nocardia huaxiensis TaxID=2755382 RepID=A0A7D6V9U0_9NOCA|nr:hypothetical protein [Nocardia huaxiensis]QLY29913.1 hypothetical protein H0264_32675 [Nocardia huaxiensis]